VKDSVVMYKEYDIGHISFMMAKDMSFFTVDVIEEMKKHYPPVKHGVGE
jgi:hypothetical protein